METVIWIIVLLIGLLIVDVIVLKQRVSKLQEQLGESIENQDKLKRQVLKLKNDVLEIAKNTIVLADNIDKIINILRECIESNDDK
mgnify:FL=1